jgi:hypothetical protein
MASRRHPVAGQYAIRARPRQIQRHSQGSGCTAGAERTGECVNSPGKRLSATAFGCNRGNGRMRIWHASRWAATKRAFTGCGLLRAIRPDNGMTFASNISRTRGRRPSLHRPRLAGIAKLRTWPPSCIASVLSTNDARIRSIVAADSLNPWSRMRVAGPAGRSLHAV